MINHKKKIINKLKDIIEILISNNNIICASGAAPRSCILLNDCKFSNKQIKYVFEVNDSKKIGKYVPGTNIKVIKEERLMHIKPDYILILAWHLESKIISLYKNKGYKGKFIVPLPKLKIC